ncbi:cofactor-independent phosphoglycerate mutase [mine drainage metagenome]|uniref:Cofactor-independent phosphoglycerate mutase n=1 Tax=mine drainage metagenome TaxID=410659 RepID=A0A1J5SIN9_9ZZZZ
MNRLHLLIPDLFPPQEIAFEVCAGLRLPALEKMLGRGKASSSRVAGLEEWLCAAFGGQSVGPVRAASEGLEVGEGYWLCADPVSLQLQHSQIMVLPDLATSQDESTALCVMLNEHFAGMGMTFFAPHPRRWYLRLEAEPQLATSTLHQVAWSDAKLHQPQGADALRWQRIVTEVQMMLYAHPLNQAREARGEQLINSLWLWGGGRAAPVVEAFDTVGGDSELAGAFARVAGIPQVESLQEMLDGKFDCGLWVCVAPREALQRGDLYAWRESVENIETEYAQPLLKALQAGRLQAVQLEVLRENGSQCFEFARGDAWKVWRTVRPLARYAV